MKKALMFLVTMFTLSLTAFSQFLPEPDIKNERNMVTYNKAISNSIQIVDASADFDDYAVPTKNTTAKSVNKYLNKQTSIDLPEFHSPQARVKYYILSGAFVGLATWFIINFIKVKGG